MTTKKAYCAIIGASALAAFLVFLAASGCGGGSSSDLTTPPRESFFSPIYYPSGGGTFADPLDLATGRFFNFFVQDDDEDGITGQEDNLHWGGDDTWTDVDQMGEGYVVLKKHNDYDQYVVLLYHTNPSPLPINTPAPTPFRYAGWSTIRIYEGYEPPANRGPTVWGKPTLSAAEGSGLHMGATRQSADPPIIAQYGLQERHEKAKRRAAVENYIHYPSKWATDHSWPNRQKIGELAGLLDKSEGKSFIPTPTPFPTADVARNVDTSSLAEGDIVYFATLSALDPWVEAEVLAVSPNSIIFGDTAFPVWGEPEVEADVTWLQQQFDRRICPRERLFFGNSDAATYSGPPGMSLVQEGIGDIDGDGRVSILITPVALDIGGGGYFYPGDMIAYDEFLFPITNEMNVIYVTPIFEDIGLTREVVAEILAHEYFHLIHYIEKTFRRVVNIYGPDVTIQEYTSALQSPDIDEMETWETEGLAMLAEDLSGYATTDLYSPVGRAWMFLLTTVGSLTEDSHLPWVDGMGYMWFRYLMEQCGGMQYPATWTDDSTLDTDYIAERVGTVQKGIDFLRDFVGRKETGVFGVEKSFRLFDKRGAREFPQAFADYAAMLLWDNARDASGTPLNTNAKYNLSRDAVWPGGIDLTTGLESGMRTHEDRVLSLFPGYAILAELDGPALYSLPDVSGFEATTDQGAGASWSFGDTSPAVWYFLFRPYRDYAFSGQYGTWYDSMEFFFSSDMPWVQSYQRFKSGVSIFRVKDMNASFYIEDSGY